MNNADIDNVVNDSLTKSAEVKYKAGISLLKKFKQGTQYKVEDANGKVIKKFVEKTNRFYDLYLQDAAYKLLKAASEEKHPGAYYELGKRYEFGLGCDINLSKAIKLYEKGVQGGHFDAVHALSNMYTIGKGVDIDEQKAKDILFNYFNR